LHTTVTCITTESLVLHITRILKISREHV